MPNNHKELYGEGYEPDPVTKNAVAAAMAATEPESREPSLWYKIAVIIGSILFILSVASSGVTTVNAVENYHQTKNIKDESICLQNVIAAQQQDQKTRTQIAADDREAIDDLIQTVFKANTSQEVKAAFAAYNKRRNENELRRNKLPEINVQCNLNK